MKEEYLVTFVVKGKPSKNLVDTLHREGCLVLSAFRLEKVKQFEKEEENSNEDL